jgi:cytochrome c553
MRLGALGFALLVAAAPALAQSENNKPPAWAYPMQSPDFFKPPPDPGKSVHVPDSTASYTIAQTRDRFMSPDWHPTDHPLMPDIVAHGRKPDVPACGSCHRASGTGGPENAQLAGLSADYMAQQIADMKNGSRGTSVPARFPPKVMLGLAKAVTEDEVRQAAAYFSALKPQPLIEVVETDVVPKARVVGLTYAVVSDSEKEPLGQRILEVPKDLDQFEYRDSRARFIAYVPTDSIAKGKALAESGSTQTFQCATCHGRGLKGQGLFPRIAGQSPSYLVRQLFDFKDGARSGANSAPMKIVTEKLSLNDMINLAAYAASLSP